MSTRDRLLHDIERFVERTGITARTFGKRAVNDNRLVERLRSGLDVTTQTMDSCYEFMRRNARKKFGAPRARPTRTMAANLAA